MDLEESDELAPRVGTHRQEQPRGASSFLAWPMDGLYKCLPVREEEVRRPTDTGRADSRCGEQPSLYGRGQDTAGGDSGRGKVRVHAHQAEGDRQSQPLGDQECGECNA